MKRRGVLTWLTVVVVASFCFGDEPEVTIMPPDELQEMITEHTVEYDFILIDVRNDNEVEEGVIATPYCKPYQMSWNLEVLQENYLLLPDNMAIIVYCRSGGRSLQAANFLIENGFTEVASLSGGYSSYEGEHADVSELKPLSDLPEPSYFGDTTKTIVTTPRKHQMVIITDKTRFNGRFTLQGRSLSSSVQQRSAPVYILERIGETSNGSIRNIRRQYGKK